ncbi:MAG: hypothetical protein WCE46_03365 [Methanoregula sp.]|jgi:hypothetical protein|uniref:hypothetical protein n=1 Tax=Methanoregula sp. TaxID=2052170 RepID=UPI003C73670C
MADEITTDQNDERQPDEEPLFDVLIPPGVPRSVIFDVVKKFDVEVVERKQKLNFANMEGDERELLAFRGRREVVEQVEKYMIERVRAFIGE